MDEINEIVGGISAPVTKLMDVTQKGVGGIFAPRQIVRIAKAKAKAIDIYADAMRRNADVLDKLNINSEMTPECQLVNRTMNRNAYQEITKQQNIESVVGKAYDQLKDEEECSNEPVDEDWIMRFFNSVEDISNEQMQELWSKVLAGEIKKPHTYSLRTLECLKNMTQHEAEIFSKFVKTAIRYRNNIIIISEYYEYKGYDFFNDFNKMKDYGLIDNGGFIHTCVKLNTKEVFAYADSSVLVFLSPKERPFDISYYRFTEAGMSLLNTIGFEQNDSKLYDFAKLYMTIKDNVKWFLHPYIPTNEKQGTMFEQINLLDSDKPIE